MHEAIHPINDARLFQYHAVIVVPDPLAMKQTTVFVDQQNYVNIPNLSLVVGALLAHRENVLLACTYLHQPIPSRKGYNPPP